jgi:hypothetical protein
LLLLLLIMIVRIIDVGVVCLIATVHNYFALNVGRNVRLDLTNAGQVVERLLVTVRTQRQIVLVLTLDVTLERTRVTVALFAAGRLALERLLVLVREHVAIQMVLSLERLVAQYTCVLALVAVYELVLSQCALVREYLAALIANLFAAPFYLCVISKQVRTMISLSRNWMNNINS